MAFYFSVQPYLSSYLQVVQEYDVTAAGRVTQTFAFISTIAAFFVSILIKYTCRYRIFVTFGCVVYVCGLLLMLLYRQEGNSGIQVLATQVIIGIGGGLVNVPVQLGVQAASNHQELASCTAFFLTSLELGGAVGSAISGLVWSRLVPEKLHRYLPPEDQDDASEIFGKMTKALSYPPGSRPRVAINRSYQETLDRLLILALVACIPLLPLSLLMTDYKLDEVGGLI